MRKCCICRVYREEYTERLLEISQTRLNDSTNTSRVRAWNAHRRCSSTLDKREYDYSARGEVFVIEVVERAGKFVTKLKSNSEIIISWMLNLINEWLLDKRDVYTKFCNGWSTNERCLFKDDKGLDIADNSRVREMMIGMRDFSREYHR